MSNPLKHYRQLVGIAKSWAEKSLPGWSDDLHRDLLHRHGAKEKNGRASASTLNIQQLGAVLEDYERRGWPRKRNTFVRGNTPKKVSPQIAQIVKLWGRLDQAGKLRNGSRPALLAFCGNHAGRDLVNLDELSVKECQGVIEALKSWTAR